jgi:hypothetical protein
LNNEINKPSACDGYIWIDSRGYVSHRPRLCLSGHLGIVAVSLDVVADSMESLADCPVFVAVFMTVGLLAVPDALLTSLDLASLCTQLWLLKASEVWQTLPPTALLYIFRMCGLLDPDLLLTTMHLWLTTSKCCYSRNIK